MRPNTILKFFNSDNQTVQNHKTRIGRSPINSKKLHIEHSLYEGQRNGVEWDKEGVEEGS